MSTHLTNPNEHSVPFDSGYFQVSEIHSLYYEQHGNKDGKPVVYLHGGPGGRATLNSSLIYFDLSIYRVILYDQRGAGKSLPLAETRNNTSQLLVQDIETLREHFGISKWHIVFGGSWGSTLAILYAETHPEVVSSLILRGIFLVLNEELDWQYRPGGVDTFFPEAATRWVQHLIDAGEDHTNPLTSYDRLLNHEDPAVVRAAAREWSRQELSTLHLHPNPQKLAEELADEDFLLPFARIEVHYFKNRAWLREGQLLEPEAIAKIRSIPTAIVQGRYDMICPPKYAWKLYQALGGEAGKCELVFTTAGHDRSEPETVDKLIELCKRYGDMEFR